MIILTGGAGFIGSCFLATLNAVGREDVLIVDSLGNGEKWKNLARHTYTDIVSKDDFRDMMALGDITDVEAVIHLGACSSTTETDADYLYDNNYRYSIDVAEFAFDCGARFIYASSAATYGNGSHGYSDLESDLQPLNMYGYSKHLFDLWIRKNGHDQKCVGLKFFNVFGPNEYHKDSMSSLVWKAFTQIGDTGKMKLFSSNHPDYQDGCQLRDFVYVKDVCQVMLQLMNSPNINGIFNLGTGKARSWNELVTAVYTAMNVTPKIEYIPMPDELASQYQNFTQADMGALSKALPDLTFGSLESSVKDYVCGHLMSATSYY